MNAVDDSVEPHIELRRQVHQTAWHLCVTSNDLRVCTLELVARVLVVTAETEPRYRRGIGVLEVGMMPVEQAHILRRHFKKALIL
jgi:hypothetical protein